MVVDADFLGAGAFFVVVVVAFLAGTTFFTAGFLVVALPSLGFLATGLASLTLPLIPSIMGSGHMSTSIAKQKVGRKVVIFQMAHSAYL